MLHTGNIGDVLIRTGEIEEAAKMYARQLTLARQYRERTMEATSYGALGLANRLMKKFDKALGYHTQELTLRQEICDMLGKNLLMLSDVIQISMKTKPISNVYYPTKANK